MMPARRKRSQRGRAGTLVQLSSNAVVLIGPRSERYGVGRIEADLS